MIFDYNTESAHDWRMVCANDDDEYIANRLQIAARITKRFIDGNAPDSAFYFARLSFRFARECERRVFEQVEQVGRA